MTEPDDVDIDQLIATSSLGDETSRRLRDRAPDTLLATLHARARLDDLRATVAPLTQTHAGAAAQPPTMPEPLHGREVRELAMVYGSDIAARQLLLQAGLPRERMPSEPDALSFWLEISTQVGHGLLQDGRRRILAAAARDYPANPVFAAGDPTDPPRLQFAAELGALRMAAGLTVREVARRADVPAGVLGDWLSGRHLPSKGASFRRVLRSLGVKEGEEEERWVRALERARNRSST